MMFNFLKYLFAPSVHQVVADIKIGDSKKDVVDLFGQPDTTVHWLGYRELQDKEEWGYGVTKITFDKSGKVIAVDRDGPDGGQAEKLRSARVRTPFYAFMPGPF